MCTTVAIAEGSRGPAIPPTKPNTALLSLLPRGAGAVAVARIYWVKLCAQRRVETNKLTIKLVDFLLLVYVHACVQS
jgi:hypothetical protein